MVHGTEITAFTLVGSMNERIKQLAKQAGFNEYINENLWPEEQPEFNNLMEKFAELIVR